MKSAWRYVKEIVRRKILAMELFDEIPRQALDPGSDGIVYFFHHEAPMIL